LSCCEERAIPVNRGAGSECEGAGKKPLPLTPSPKGEGGCSQPDRGKREVPGRWTRVRRPVFLLTARAAGGLPQ
jgi:hypothetical protein